MTIRTISQLPTATNANDEHLLEMSENLTGKYQSRKLPIGTLKTKFTADISASVGSSFRLYKTGSSDPIDVNALSAAVNELQHGTMTVNGVKTFSSIPHIPTSLSYTTDPQQVANVKEVKQLIDDRSLFIGANYMVDADPGTDNTPSTTRQRDEFMYWHIDDLGKDSTQWMNPEFGNQKTEINGVECEHTGYLNMFGWLADNGNVRPSDAWVGLFAQVQVRDTESAEQSLKSKWILLQLHPWILGQKCSARQYVSFNVPVKAGLRLKVKTGFAVNGHNGGFTEQGDVSLALNQPNSFVGYIIRAQD